MKYLTVITGLVVAFAGFLLASYAGADDSPGGVLLGMVVVLAAMVVVVRTLRRAG